MTIAVCPGSYDPVTAGHLDVIQRCTHLFDEVHVLVAVNAAKTPLFSESERVQIIREAVKNLRNTHSNCSDTSADNCADVCSCNNAGKIVVSSTTGLITDYCKRVGATAIVKGLRQNGDYEAELGMALVNRKLAGIETLFLPADPILEHVSSSVVKDVARHGGNVTGMVPDNVIPLLQKLFAEQSSDQSNNSVTLNN
ncbi:pantetheine-phosphate adenylyltransferase [Gardnerella greenwoodii]|uniref:pantetheine-phosphate adenylyltransferase n=1 Tax=Gardnerella greenwoodii TaxID=2914925 RepID=UPI0039F0E5E8